jgi:hypothetical protein
MAKSKTKAPARKATPAKAAKQPKAPRTVYRVSEATEGRQLVGEYATADEATRKGLAHVAKHGVDVEVSRGMVTGSEFKAEFTEVLKNGNREAVEPTAVAPVATDAEADAAASQPATDAANAEGAPKAEPAAKPAKRGRQAKVAPPKAAKPRTKTPAKPKKMSALDAAAKVLVERGGSMSSQELIEAMSEKGYWTSPNGATPHATLYAAILREISAKGSLSRFQKTDKGRFAIVGPAAV